MHAKPILGPQAPMLGLSSKYLRKFRNTLMAGQSHSTIRLYLHSNRVVNSKIMKKLRKIQTSILKQIKYLQLKI